MTLTRRVLLSLVAALGSSACTAAVPDAAPGTPPARRIAYGPGPAQFGMLHLPAGTGRVPVVVIVHGGYWRQAYGLDLGTPLAVDLTNAGVAAWNIEYRRIGGGGGYPATLADVATAVDALAGPAVDPRADVTRTVLLGHSAGGQLAVWAASRRQDGPGGPATGALVRPRGVVAQAGVLDLVVAAEQGLGGGAVAELLGGGPVSVPDRYAASSPIALVPPPVPVVCVHGRDDVTVPLDQSARYVAAAGAAARLETIADADHLALVDPATPAWASCRRAVLALAET